MTYLTAYPLRVQGRSFFIILWGSLTLQKTITPPLNTHHFPLKTVMFYIMTT